jgi:hypothetical protein
MLDPLDIFAALIGDLATHGKITVADHAAALSALRKEGARAHSPRQLPGAINRHREGGQRGASRKDDRRAPSGRK